MFKSITIKRSSFCLITLSLVLSCFFFSSCKQEAKKTGLENFEYERFRDSLVILEASESDDTANIFDDPSFTPGVDSLDEMLIAMDTAWRREAALMEHLDTVQKGLSAVPGFTPEDKLIINENINMVDSFLLAKDTTEEIGCQEMDCLLFVEIDKSTQKLYLYLFGELKDSFTVSTGTRKFETPNLNLHPAGPILTKYSSKKFPGGNYEGLGNMPYAIFLRGGYAIHGTTPGNFSKLGTRASHGCIRLHPDNAKVLNALVKIVGLDRTWVSIKSSRL